MKSIPLDLCRINGKNHGDYQFKYHDEGVEIQFQKPQCDKNTYYLSLSELILLKEDIERVLGKPQYVDVMKRIYKGTKEEEGFMPFYE